MKQAPPLDWASKDPNQNITLAEVNAFANNLTAASTLQVVDLHVLRQDGEVVSADEVKGNNYQSENALNFYGRLAIGQNSPPFNIAQVRGQLRDAIASDDPVGGYVNTLKPLMDGADPQSYFLRSPAAQKALQALFTGV